MKELAVKYSVHPNTIRKHLSRCRERSVEGVSPDSPVEGLPDGGLSLAATNGLQGREFFTGRLQGLEGGFRGVEGVEGWFDACRETSVVACGQKGVKTIKGFRGKKSDERDTGVIGCLEGFTGGCVFGQREMSNL